MSYSKRTRTLKNGSFVGESVLYWMVRDKRFNDNWALLAAQKAALKNKVPLHVCFQYNPKAKTATLREYDFLFKGLKETELTEVPCSLSLCRHSFVLISQSFMFASYDPDASV